MSVLITAASLAGVNAQDATAIGRGTLHLTGGACGPGVLEKFASIAGGPSTLPYYIHSASSGIRLPSGLELGRLGIGLDEQAAPLVRATRFEVPGTERVAIHDDRLHNGRWFYYLTPGTPFHLENRSTVP